MASIAGSTPIIGGGAHFSIHVPPSEQSTAMFVTDPDAIQRFIAEREETGADRWDEVWDGVYVMNPLPNDEHQELVSRLDTIFNLVVVWPGLGKVRPGVNVTDRQAGWQRNYRGPDVVVLLNETKARNFDTHWVGGPDFLVEILSRGDRSRQKLPFYASIGVRETLIVDRDPWAMELYRLDAGELKLVDRSTLKQPQTLVSQVIPLRFRLVAGDERPRIEIVHSDGVQQWLA